jgi:hypothetical protein
MKKDPQGKARVGEALALFFDGLKVYGKDPDSLENATKLFHFVLADYPVDKIIDAFSYYLKHNTEFPAPADIANIIERGNKPPFDRSVYVTISKKDPCDRSSEEWAYMCDYEHFQLSGGY